MPETVRVLKLLELVEVRVEDFAHGAHVRLLFAPRGRAVSIPPREEGKRHA